MKVSVLTPIYKTDAGLLREAIGSVLNQTWRDFELLLLDDCPDDSRESVVREFDDPRIVYLKNDANLGISASRNRLIDLAKGEYLAVFDHDDVCLPRRLELEVAYLDAHPECGVVGGWIKPTDGTPSRFPADDHEIKLAMMESISVWHPTAMVRASLLRDAAVRYDPEFSPVEDYMLWMRLIPLTKFHNLQEVVLNYRWHKTNTSIVRRDSLTANDIRCRAWARVHLPELWAEAELRCRRVSRYRVFGLPVLKVEADRKETVVRLFDRLPVVRVKRRFGM